MPKLIAVNDGQVLWAADQAQFLSVLEAHGWQRDGNRVKEPDGAVSSTAYSLLCAALPPQAGEGSSESMPDPDTMGEFVYRPDWGGDWELTLAPVEG